MIVIDTHILIWWVSGSKRLSNSAKKSIEKTLADDSGEILVSSISAWEIAMLVKSGRLALSMDVESWLEEVSQIEGLRFLPVDNEIGFKSAALPGGFHKDPADRMIVATARTMAMPLVTADEKILQYEHVKTIW